MRIAIEVTDNEHGAFKALARSFNDSPSVSALIRCLLRLALTGKVPRAEIEADLSAGKAGRAVLNVTLAEGAKAPRAIPGAPSPRRTGAEILEAMRGKTKEPLTPARKRK